MTKATSFNAGPALTGYLFQCRLALLQSLRMVKRSPNGQISIEKFDDISFESGDLSKCLMQDKHSVGAKPLDDKSGDPMLFGDRLMRLKMTKIGRQSNLCLN